VVQKQFGFFISVKNIVSMSDKNNGGTPPADQNQNGGDQQNQNQNQQGGDEGKVDPAKLLEENENYKKALAEERTKRQAEQADLERYRKEEQERKDKDLKAKGKFEELETQLRTENETVKKQLEEVLPIVKEYQEYLANQVTALMDTIPNADDKQLVSELLDGKSDKEKLERLPKLLERFGKKQDFGGEPPK
jgi:hypothetical protein